MLAGLKAATSDSSGGGSTAPESIGSGMMSRTNLADFGGSFASGGNPPVGKVSLVGEKGIELFVPHTPGTIIPNHHLQAVLAAATSAPSSGGATSPKSGGGGMMSAFSPLMAGGLGVFSPISHGLGAFSPIKGLLASGGPVDPGRSEEHT